MSIDATNQTIEKPIVNFSSQTAAIVNKVMATQTIEEPVEFSFD